MTDREKLIELLDETFDKQYDKNLVITARNTADHLIANGVTVNEWISVKDRLPDKDGHYLVHKDLWGDRYVATVWFAKDGRKVSRYDFENRWKNVWYDYDSEYGNVILDNVTHWMPLPQPPKGE